jgi:hypothetical protein
MMKIWFFSFLVFLSINAFAHKPIKRVVVFPIAAEKSYKMPATNAWWRMREVLTENQRYLIASKKFLLQKEVFQPRKQLKPSDAILLGKLLDADALITVYVETDQVNLEVYSGSEGFVLWKNSIPFDSSKLKSEQIVTKCEALLRDFVAGVPYQGFHHIDPMVGKAVFEEGDVKQAKITIGDNSMLQEKDTVFWISIDRLNTQPLFQNGGKVEVIAEGEVIRIDSEGVLVEVKRAKNISLLQEDSLVQIPRVSKLWKERYALKNQKEIPIGPEVVTSEMRSARKKETTDALTVALTSIGNLAAFLLLAF